MKKTKAKVCNGLLRAAGNEAPISFWWLLSFGEEIG